MNTKRIQQLLDEHLNVPIHEQNATLIDLLEALLDDDYDPDLGKTESTS